MLTGELHPKQNRIEKNGPELERINEIHVPD